MLYTATVAATTAAAAAAPHPPGVPSERLPGDEAPDVDGLSILELLARDDHLLEGREGREHRAANPCGILPLGVHADVDLAGHLDREELAKLAPQPWSKTGKHRGAARHDKALDEVLPEVEVARLDRLHADTLHRGHVVAAGIVEEDLRGALPDVVVHLNDLSVWKLEGLRLLVAVVALHGGLRVDADGANLLLQRLHNDLVVR